MTRPARVTLRSPASVQVVSSPGRSRIVRSFTTVKGWPCLPTRTWRWSTGPPSSLMTADRGTMITPRRIRAGIATITSRARLRAA